MDLQATKSRLTKIQALEVRSHLGEPEHCVFAAMKKAQRALTASDMELIDLVTPHDLEAAPVGDRLLRIGRSNAADWFNPHEIQTHALRLTWSPERVVIALEAKNELDS